MAVLIVQGEVPGIVIFLLGAVGVCLILFLLWKFVEYLFNTCSEHNILWYGAHLWLTIAGGVVLAVGAFLARDHSANLPIALIVSSVFFSCSVGCLYWQTGKLGFSLVFSISIAIAGLIILALYITLKALANESKEVQRVNRIRRDAETRRDVYRQPS